MVKRISAMMWLVLILTLGLYPVKQAEAHAKVSSFREFRTACGERGEETIELLNDIPIEGPVVIRGRKRIDGHGHTLERSKEKGKVYGGCLFLVRDGECQWENVTVSGGGTNKNVLGKVFGRLVEVRQGSMTIGEKCLFCDNINDRLIVDGGGAIQIGSNGICIMKAGEIRNNQNVSRGAGFFVEKGGYLTVKGGFIRNNKVMGAGAVKEFDGRGGAIYSEGSVSIVGGTIAGNQAQAYHEGEIRYGGIGAAVYVDSGSALYVGGGMFYENSDDRKSPFWIQGNLTLAGKPVLERVYLSSDVYIRTNGSFYPRKKVFIQPEKYRTGTCLVKGKRTPFELVPKKLFKLERRLDGCYIKKVTRKPASTKKTEKKEPEVRLQMSPSPSPAKRKTRKPKIFTEKSHFVFYVGEIVERQVMLYGVRAEDSRGDDITDAVKIIQPKNEILPTDKEGRGKIIYEVENRKGVKTKAKITYEIQKNHPPVVRTAPRFLFISEVEGYTGQQWKALLLQGCRLSDDCEMSGELEESTVIDLRNLKEMRAGKWEVVLNVRDQYGHRFYMRKGEKRRYGKGIITAVNIPVTLVDYSDLGQKDIGYIRFTEPGAEDKVQEEWSFTANQIGRIQKFMDAREDPFDQNTNQEFLRIFKECKTYEEDVEE